MSLSILLVDDDQALCRALGRELTRRSFQVTLAHDVESAFSALVDARLIKRSPIDVLVTDLRLGGWDGLDLLRELHRLSPATRSVLMSGFASSKDHETARQYGAVGVLSKPFEIDELVGVIEKAVDCQSCFHGDIHGLTLVDLVQIFHHSRRSLAIAVSGPVKGEIHLKDGQVVDAISGDLRGERALREILDAPSGYLRTTSLPETVRTTITRDVTSLLLDMMKQLDERRAHRTD